MRIIVELRGGVVTQVYSDDALAEVSVLDHDAEECGEEHAAQMNRSLEDKLPDLEALL